MTTAAHEMRTDTTPATAYGPGVSSVLSGAIAILLCFAFATRAAADDEPRFHRTTPRGSFERDGVTLVVGVPGGRAWGIESDLRPVPAGGGLRVSLAVEDPAVREAFVRVAYYDRASGRPRQIAIADAPLVHDGDRALLTVALDPPPGAVAYRVRVLARLTNAGARSLPDAVRARIGPGRVRDADRRPYSRLRAEVP
jgi:hypothetical protein